MWIEREERKDDERRGGAVRLQRGEGVEEMGGGYKEGRG